MKPLVSIASTCYNHAKFLDEYFDSVLSQTYKNIEIIIGDDNSTDGSQDILKKYYKKYPDKIKILLNKENLGITQNASNILRNCKGKYVALISTDDLMLPTKIEKQVSVLERKKDVNICFHELEVFYEDGNCILFSKINKYTPQKGNIREIIKYGTFMGSCSVMVRRKNIPFYFFDDRIKIASDWKFLIDVVKDGEFYFINEVLGKYRRHNENVTYNKAVETLNDHIVTCGILMSEYSSYLEEIEYRLSDIFLEKGIALLKNNKDGFKEIKASLHFRKTLKNVLLYILLNGGISFEKLEKIKNVLKKSL